MGRHESKSSHRPGSVTVDHQLNNDLAIIVGECDLLDDLLAEGTDASARVKLIKITAQRMADKINARPRPVRANLDPP
jgi:hypothetical protein